MSIPNHAEFKGRRLATVGNMVKLPEYRHAFTGSAIRHVLFKATTNGLQEAGAVVRVGRRVLIDLDAFDAWLDSMRSKSE